MSKRQDVKKRSAIVGPALAFVMLAAATLVLLALSSLLQGLGLSALTAPVDWLRNLDSGLARDTLANAADMVAAVLSIAITVVAIVVELAANRYSHRITWLFVREPVNIITMSLLVITTLLCVWVAVTLNDSSGNAALPNAGFALCMVLVTLSLLILLPYFAFVFAFLSPLSIIRKIRDRALRQVESCRAVSAETAQFRVEEAVDELQDVARRAVELGDRGVAMATVEALADLITRYQNLRAGLPKNWFRLHDAVATDPDFVALAGAVREEIENDGSWLEIKVMRQYLWLMNQSVHKARDIANLIAIHTKRIAVVVADHNPPLLELCIRCMNSYLRTAINVNDPRTGYYVLNQYRKLAEHLLAQGNTAPVEEIALQFKFYGLLGFKTGQPFMLEVAAYDLSQLIVQSIERDSPLVDALLALLLTLDEEIRAESGETSLIGVRRSQIQIATMFAMNGDFDRMNRISDDLKTDEPGRLWDIQEMLTKEDRQQYWEFTDRGINFQYLPPERREYLPKVLYWLEQNRTAQV